MASSLVSGARFAPHQRRAEERDGVPMLPRTPADIAEAAAALGLSIPDACMAGVSANLDLLARHADTLMARAGRLR